MRLLKSCHVQKMVVREPHPAADLDRAEGHDVDLDPEHLETVKRCASVLKVF